jgi:NADH:ubiquinone oxidoreductase subunit
MSLLNRFFTWWNGQTIGTALYTRRNGQRVGEDGQGNVYYQTADGKRRWVIYNGESEASRVPPDWHGWLHHTFEAPPSVKPLETKPWERPHRPNMTGTNAAYLPPGSVETPARRPRATGDYEAWQPE